MLSVPAWCVCVRGEHWRSLRARDVYHSAARRATTERCQTLAATRVKPRPATHRDQCRTCSFAQYYWWVLVPSFLQQKNCIAFVFLLNTKMVRQLLLKCFTRTRYKLLIILPLHHRFLSQIVIRCVWLRPVRPGRRPLAPECRAASISRRIDCRRLPHI